MDSACCFKLPNVILGAEGSSSGTLGCSSSSLTVRCRNLSHNFFGHPRFVSKTCTPRSMKKTISKHYRGEFDNLSRTTRLRGSFDGNLSNILKISRAAVLLQCQGDDSLAYVDGNCRNVELMETSKEGRKNSSTESLAIGSVSDVEAYGSEKKEEETPSTDDLRELLQKALKELEVSQLNSTMFEGKAQKISETAIALKDKATDAWNDVNTTLNNIQEIIAEESVAKEVVQKATMALSMAEARLQLAVETLEATKGTGDLPEASTGNDAEDVTATEASYSLTEEEEAIIEAQDEISNCRATLAYCEAELRSLQSKKEELQKEVDRLSEVAEKVQMDALKAEEDVANIMLLAEQAVAFELEATQRVNDAEISVQRAEKVLSNSNVDMSDSSTIPLVASSQGQMSNGNDFSFASEDELSQRVSGDVCLEEDKDGSVEDALLGSEPSLDRQSDASGKCVDDLNYSDDLHDQENGKLSVDSYKEAEAEAEKSKTSGPTKKQEIQKDLSKDSLPLCAPKALLKKSSRFFPASFFSFSVDGTEFTPASVFHGIITFARKQVPKLVIGILLLGVGVFFLINRAERSTQLLQQPDVITTGIGEVSPNTKPLIREIQRFPKRVKKLIEMLPHQEINEEEASLFDMLWLLLASVIFVPLFQKIPGGSPVLGYLAAGILIGPYGLSIIRHVHGTKAIAEFGVVFLLFNIGLELSVERLSSMKKYVFGLGSAQVLVTAVVVGLVTHFSGQSGPAAIVIGNGLALSSTAVVLQVLQERGESTSRHGRATFSVLLFQDLAVVVLLILIPLISPNSSKGGVGFQAIAEALGLAAVKAAVAITAIIAGGRLLLRPIYRQIAENQNAEIFSANTLLVILGTSLLTARAGLSMALGAFLAGLLLAETEFSLQVESDIAPYRGLLLGLFFMTVGMSIDPKLLLSNFPIILVTLGLLIGGKAMLVTLVGRIFGISTIAAIRVGLLLAPGGEFAFVAFGEAVNQGIMSPQLSSLLFLVVGISMALTPWLAAGGQLIASRFEQHDVRSLLPVESETDDLQDHIILCGFGRVGQIIAQLLSECLIPFVALDVRSDRVAVGRALDLPVYFGDAGSREVLHKVGAERACAAAITLDTPGANYRTVWALSKYFPNVKTFVRAHDVDHGLNLEKAGATAVVPETLEPSLQLAAAVLAQAKMPMSEIAATIDEFRTRHLSELTELCEARGSSLGYGFSRIMSKPKSQGSDSLDDNEVAEGTLAI
ncbi:K(+) efflux antiporter 2, chloroplastic-like [Macadamia integrifolia]|uniref:K(+) efflux antiporter 2, chloroplastic-like n=1 Tax=Macadamia integrifolia TaxID=60698 RepID=UPI001C4E5224|nr:K(+) efflux antiporter 2, chloroplastic-like [Macadamia integrifolia]XP_042512287.1 K(+) efflux antiporter 2, chloroplastic-like [Macadamia integrifolia]